MLIYFLIQFMNLRKYQIAFHDQNTFSSCYLCSKYLENQVINFRQFDLSCY